MKPTLVILAAGMASRYGSMKQIQSFGPGGETIMDYSIYDAIKAGFGKIVFIIREEFAENFKAIFEPKLNGRIDTDYVYQHLTDFTGGRSIPPERTKPWGTAHAVLCCKGKVNEPFAVINADDYYGRDAFVKAYDFLTTQCNSKTYCIVGYELKNTLVDFVRTLGHEVEDCGSYTYDLSDDYPGIIAVAAKKLSDDISHDVQSRAILLGGSGQGEAMVANRFSGVRAAVYYGEPAKGAQPDAAGKVADLIHLIRVHNNANALSLGARFVTTDEAREAVRMWLSTEFSGEDRHAKRNRMIDHISDSTPSSDSVEISSPQVST